MDDMRARVRVGIELLDDRGPKDWRDRIDLSILDLLHYTTCILGQVYAADAQRLNSIPRANDPVSPYLATGYDVGIDQLGLSRHDTYLCGFTNDDPDNDDVSLNEAEGYRDLTEAWREALR